MMGRYRKSNKQIAEDNRNYIDQQVDELCATGDFTHEQREQIKKGFESGLSYRQVQEYAKPQLSPKHMSRIIYDFKLGLSVEDIRAIYSGAGFNSHKRKKILKNNLMMLYAKSIKVTPRKHEMNADVPLEQNLQDAQTDSKKRAEKKRAEKKRQIESGLRNKKVARGEQLFSDPALTVKQIIQIQVGLEHGLSLEQVEYYAKRKFSDLQMAQIRRGFEAGLSEIVIGLYAKTDLNNLQMMEIRKGLESGLSFEDVKEYAVRNLSAEDMRSRRSKLEKIAHQSESNQIETQAISQDPPPILDKLPQTHREVERKAKSVHSTVTVKSYFSEQFISNVKRQDESVWNAWVQSKQIFIFEDAFAAQLLSNADAAEEVQGEALINCPFTTSYIIGKEEDGTKLEFFAVLDGNVLRFQQMQNEEAGQSYELRIDQHWIGKQMLDAMGMPLLRDTAMKMLQLYSCLCSATLEQAHDIVARSEPLLPSGTTPKRDRSEKKEIPDWDVDIYTVTMRREIKKQHRRAKANDSTDPLVRRPHPRRAHWHHYWVGSRKDMESRRLVLKWIPEIVVNQKEDDMPVRIILVRNYK